MAESITEGTLKTWVKKVGDTVAQDEEVATIETDKAHALPRVSTATDQRLDRCFCQFSICRNYNRNSRE